MLLLSPINGYYNLVLLLLPLLAALGHLECYPDRRALRWLILATALVCIPPGWTHVHPAIYDTLHRGMGLVDEVDEPSARALEEGAVVRRAVTVPQGIALFKVHAVHGAAVAVQQVGDGLPGGDVMQFGGGQWKSLQLETE